MTISATLAVQWVVSMQRLWNMSRTLTDLRIGAGFVVVQRAIQRHLRLPLLVVLMGTLLTGACASRQAPSVAHIHVGHAITGAHDTKGQVGYLVLAAEHADTALEAAKRAAAPGQSMPAIRAGLERVNAITNNEGKFPLSKAVVEALNHVQYAADSDDASPNIKAGSRAFADRAAGIVLRSELIRQYTADAKASTSLEEVQQFAQEIERLAVANVLGEDTNGDDRISEPREYGVRQIQAELDAMVSRENPPYATVDRWYLFNLIRLPNGNWIFRRSGSNAGSGY